jgi:hypothetical protein
MTYQLRIGPRQRPFVGWIWHLSAVGVALVILQSAGLRVAVGPIALALLLFPALLYRQGHRHFVRSGIQSEQDDPRPPVVYLRSFHDEPSLRQHEEALGRIFSTDGPFIAIGDPNDSTPQIAARRDYVEDWQSLILSRLERCRYVLLLAGTTPGLEWELEQCRQNLRPGQVLVWVPGGGIPEGFRTICDGFGIVLPQSPGQMGIVVFDAEWHGRFEPFARIVVLDPLFLFENEEASWRATFRSALPNEHFPDPAYTINLAEHWRILPLVALAVIGINLLPRLPLVLQ